MKTTRWGGVCLFVFALFLGARPSGGQTNGEIRGVVNDPSGAAIPNAKVTAVMVGTQSTRTVTSGADGSFDLPEEPVGTYDVSAEAKGFKKFVAEGVVVSIGHVNFLTLTLQVGAAEQTVTVEANAVQVETTSTQIGAVMTDQSIRELPLNTRNAYQLLQLQPGVQSQLGADLFYGSDNPGVVSVNGGRGRSNNYMVNGGDGNDLFVNAPAIQPSPDAIQEFRVITNTFDAEYGRNSGSIVNVVTKSGTNEVHGDFYEFFRNDVLNTRGYFDPTIPEWRQNQFGGTLGGPIKKDKTFLFGSYEGNRLIEGISSGLIFLPSADEGAGNFNPNSPFQGMVSNPTFATQLANRTTGNTGRTCQQAVMANGGSPIQPGVLYSQIFPQNNVPIECFDASALALYRNYVAPYGTGQVSFVPNQDEYVNQFTIRFDQKVTNNQQLTIYYYFNNDNNTVPFSNFQAAGANLPGFPALSTTRGQQWNISHTWTLSSTSVNEFRFNYFREGQANLNHPVNTLTSIHDACGSAVPPSNCFSDPSNPSLGITTNIPGHMGVPFVSVSGGFAIGNNFEGELPQAGNTFQWADNFTKILGVHTLKFGAEVYYNQFNQFLYYNINGDFTITNGLGGPNEVGYADNGYADYFLGVVNTYSQGAAQAENDRNTAFYLFAQDSWKLKSNLTLNYGLRWELNTPYYDLGNRLQTFRPGQATTQYPCWTYTAGSINAGIPAGDCSESGPNNSVFPLGLVFPGDQGVPSGLTATYYKAFAPRIGIAWSPNNTEGFLGKIFGGPGKSSIRAGYGIFYNPIEQLVLEQFSAEPPFGGSSFSSYPNFNLPFLPQSSDPVAGPFTPNPFMGIINQTPTTPCPDPAGPKGCVDWASFRPLLLYGEFAPHLKTQYAEQYNLTIQRQLSNSMVFTIAYVGTQAHHLLASHDLDYGYPDTCREIAQISSLNPANVLSYTGGPQTSCSPFSADLSYFIAPGTTIPSYTSPKQPFPVITSTCNGLLLPYGTINGSSCVPAGSVVGANGITFVGLRKYSSPNCDPGTGVGCPPDGVPVFSNIFSEDTMANSNYNGLQVSVEKSYSHGLMFQTSYTFSKAIDQGASFENELNPIYFNATRGTSLLDAKNRFVFSPVWDLPIPKYDGFKGKALDGWGASAIIIYQSGFPIRMQDANDEELMSSFFFEDANTPYASAPVQFINPKTNDNLWFNTANFCDAATATPAAPCPQVLGAFGNTPHALCCGPAISNTDLVISKKTPLNERWNTEFRAEFYNAWNHTQFNNPDGNFSDTTFGLITKTREGPRVMQFAMKVFF
jgi:hypothetical protein